MSDDERTWRVVPTREGYDRWAPTYDSDGNPLLALEEPEVDRALGAVAGLDLLDAGCGTGRHALRLARAGSRVTAIDFSEPMLAQARAKAGAERVRFLVHDLAAPFPFAAASFDRVLCALVLEHVAEPGDLFAELDRVTKPDGRIVVTAMHPAMFLKGVSARFLDGATGELVRPRSYVLQLSDYVMGALAADLRIVAMSEHSPDENLAQRLPRAAKYVGWPMLLVMTLAPRVSSEATTSRAVLL